MTAYELTEPGMERLGYGVGRTNDQRAAKQEIDRLRAENARLKALVDFALEHGDAT